MWIQPFLLNARARSSSFWLQSIAGFNVLGPARGRTRVGGSCTWLSRPLSPRPRKISKTKQNVAEARHKVIEAARDLIVDGAIATPRSTRSQ